jgi:hypothetical protein
MKDMIKTEHRDLSARKLENRTQGPFCKKTRLNGLF